MKSIYLFIYWLDLWALRKGDASYSYKKYKQQNQQVFMANSAGDMLLIFFSWEQ